MSDKINDPPEQKFKPEATFSKFDKNVFVSIPSADTSEELLKQYIDCLMSKYASQELDKAISLGNTVYLDITNILKDKKVQQIVKRRILENL